MSRIRQPRASSRTSLLLLALAVLAAGGVVQLGDATSANAAVWEDVTCSLNARPASTEGWTSRFLGTPSRGAAATNTCPEGGTLTASDESRGETQNTGSGAEWKYMTPKGEPIAGGTVTLTAYSANGQAWLSTPEVIAGEGVTLVSCFGSTCSYPHEVPITKHGAGQAGSRL